LIEMPQNKLRIAVKVKVTVKASKRA